MSKKLCLIYNTAPRYREAIFRAIDEEYDCDWYFGHTKTDIKEMDTYLFRFMSLLSFPLPLWFVILTQMTMGLSLYSDAKNMMVPDYYIVGNLRKDYEESYSKLGHRWKDYAQRKYDIIDKVQKDGLLMLDIKPSFDESFEGSCEGLFDKMLDDVRQIRNDIMHFEPDGFSSSQHKKFVSDVRLLNSLLTGKHLGC